MGLNRSLNSKEECFQAASEVWDAFDKTARRLCTQPSSNNSGTVICHRKKAQPLAWALYATKSEVQIHVPRLFPVARPCLSPALLEL